MKQMKSNPVKTALTISMGFLLIYIFGHFNWALTVSVVVGLIGLFSGTLSRWIEIAWMKLATVLSYIVPNILMAVIFFCLLLPISLLSKVFRRKDTLKLKNSAVSVYTEKPGAYDKHHFENMW